MSAHAARFARDRTVPYPILALITATVLICSAAPVAAQSMPTGFREEFLLQFGSSTSKFIALAQAMPAEKYTWSPGQGVMPVAQVYAHVARYNYFYPANHIGISAPADLDLDSLEQIRDKEAIVALLTRSRDHVEQLVKELPEEQWSQPTQLYGRTVQNWAVLLQLLAHMNEHLGQSIAYARMNGVVPPWSQ